MTPRLLEENDLSKAGFELKTHTYKCVWLGSTWV
jgi:hypothetical protein